MLFYLQNPFLRSIQLARVELFCICKSTGNQRIHFVCREVGKLAFDKCRRFFFGDAVPVVCTSKTMQVIVLVSDDVFSDLL